MADLVEFQRDGGLDQLAHRHLPGTACWQAERGNNGDALASLNETDLCCGSLQNWEAEQQSKRTAAA
jgi:hypothetical protein